MKKHLLATAAAFATVAAFGQGQINFGNASSLPGWYDGGAIDRSVKFGSMASLYNPALTAGGLVSTNFNGVNLTSLQATLYWSLTGGTDLSTYTRALFPSPATFKNSTSAVAGSWFSKTATLGGVGNGVANGTQGWLIAVVWDTSKSSDPLSSAAMQQGLWGASAPFTYTPPTGLFPTQGELLPQNLRTFTIGMIPEPCTFALAGLGAAALTILRRRKG